MNFFFFQAEDGIRDKLVTGVQTCALPISPAPRGRAAAAVMIGLVLGVALAAAAVWFVLAPILRPAAADAEAGGSGDAGDDPEDDLSPRAVALRALKEIEFDRATGKLTDADYD